MVVLNFTLSEDGVAVLHDALSCMFKFSDDVCLEAKKDKLTLSTLNISKSAYVCFTFAASRFFSRYHFEGTPQNRDRFYCGLYIKSLLTIFRSRQSSSGGGELGRDRDSSIERCEVAIDDGEGKKSRLIARISCRNGITASHSLPYEVRAPTHAKFDKTSANNRWSISSRTLRQLMDHFGPGIELLDINTDDESRVVNFTCFTEKPQRRGPSSNNEAVLKKPLHTNVAVDMDEFDDVDVEDHLHIIISVKDFRALLYHAHGTGADLSTLYSNPGRPMRLAYSIDGLLCEFIVMTVGEKDAVAQKHKNGRATASGANAKGKQQQQQPQRQQTQALDAASRRGSSVPGLAQNHEGTPGGNGRPAPTPRPSAGFTAPSSSRSIPPRRPGQHPAFEIRPQPQPQQPSREREDSPLFVDQGEGTENYDEDQQWEPVNPDAEDDLEDNTRLEWNATGEPNPSAMRISSRSTVPEPPQDLADNPLPSGLEPTQRLSQVRHYGLFSS